MKTRLTLYLLVALFALATAMPTEAAREKRGQFKSLKSKIKKAKEPKLAKNKKAALKYLDKKGIQPGDYDKALITSLEEGDCKTAAALIHAGAAVNAGGNEKKPLLLAAEHCTPEIIKLLLEKGADPECVDIQPIPNAMSMGKTVMFMAAKANNLENLKYLHSIGFSCTARTKDSHQGSSVLAEAVMNGSLECVRYIIEKGGATPHEKFPGGMTLMHRAARNGNMEVIKLLDSHGVGIDTLATGYGLTPLCFAGQRGNQEAMQYLLARGANPNLDLGRGGAKQLHVLAARANQKTMQMLLKSKADFSLKNNAGKTFRDIAREAGNQEALDFLDKHGL